MSIFHDITNYKHRSCLGALRCGESEMISLYAPEANASGGELVVHGDDFNFRCQMRRDGDNLCADFTAPEKPQVLWYHFLLHGFPYDFFCGAAENGIDSVILNDWPKSFQLTVYSAEFETPDWFCGSVMYQIFPDRFSRDDSDTAKQGISYHRSMGRRIRYHEEWNEQVCWKPEQGEKDYYPNDFFGGTIRGIIEKLPYINSLGVGVIYLNPIFEADSNHRYNTSDYMRIDPVLGDEADFTKLCTIAGEMGIRIMLDGVFSHTGSDSVYFNREKRYETPGAYQGKQSPYFKWFDFQNFPDKYRAWWGFKSLPEVDERVSDWQKFIYKDENSVVPYWLGAGASGWRLDVADELPDEVLAGIYTSAKTKKPDSIVLGEVWEDPTTKESYGIKRKYALGGMLDSVMNYPLRAEIIDFITGETSARVFCDFMLRQRLYYPRPMYFALMNLLSSHDVPRIRTALGTNVAKLHGDKAVQAEFILEGEENIRAAKLQKMCAVLQFAIPGVPCIYYGDEQGMQGAFDPFDRGTFSEEDIELKEFYSGLAEARNQSEALKFGEVGFCAPDDDIICILRASEKQGVLTVVNRGSRKQCLKLEISKDFRGLPKKTVEAFNVYTIEMELEPISWLKTEI